MSQQQQSQPVTQIEIDQRVYDLYDEYCHGRLIVANTSNAPGARGAGHPRAGDGAPLIPQYAKAQTISFTDPRIKASYVTYPSPGGNGDGKDMRGYLVQPTGNGPFPAVLIIHENRGLNPTSKTSPAAPPRRLSGAGTDGLAPLGGYPGNDDDGRTLQAKLDQAKLRTDMLNGAKWLKAHKLSTGKAQRHRLLLGRRHQQLPRHRDGRDLQASAPYYGAAAATADVGKIKAAMLIHFAAKDDGINAMWPAYEAALKAAGTRYEAHTYPDTQHGFPQQLDAALQRGAAKLSWDRTIEHFKKHLA